MEIYSGKNLYIFFISDLKWKILLVLKKCEFLFFICLYDFYTCHLYIVLFVRSIINWNYGFCLCHYCMATWYFQSILFVSCSYFIYHIFTHCFFVHSHTFHKTTEAWITMLFWHKIMFKDNNRWSIIIKIFLAFLSFSTRPILSYHQGGPHPILEFGVLTFCKGKL